MSYEVIWDETLEQDEFFEIDETDNWDEDECARHFIRDWFSPLTVTLTLAASGEVIATTKKHVGKILTATATGVAQMMDKAVGFNLFGSAEGTAVFKKAVSFSFFAICEPGAVVKKHFWVLLHAGCEAAANIKRTFLITLTAIITGNSKIIAEVFHQGDTPLSWVTPTFITKFNASFREVLSKVKVFFNGDRSIPEVFDADNVTRIELLEELGASTSNPLGTVSSNECVVGFDNNNRIMTPTNIASPYYGKLTPNILIIPYLGVLITNPSDSVQIYEYVSLGNFRTRDWNAPSESMETTVPCYDKLYQLSQRDVPAMRARPDTLLSELLSMVLESVGLTTGDYDIDAALNVPVNIGWIIPGKLISVLQYLLNGVGFAYMGRSGKLLIKSLSILQSAAVEATLTDINQIIVASVPTEYLNAYTKVTMNRFIPTLKTLEEVLTVDLTIPASGTINIEYLKFNRSPVAVIKRVGIMGGTSDVVMSSIEANAWDISFTLTNSALTEKKVTIQIYGHVIEQASIETTSINAPLELIIGRRELKIDGPMIQDETFVTSNIALILSVVSDPNMAVFADIRGNPAFTPSTSLLITDPADKLSDETVLLVRHKLSYDGGLSASIDCIRSI